MRKAFTLRGVVNALCLCIFLLAHATNIASAQEAPAPQPLVNLGDAVVSGFSGILETGEVQKADDGGIDASHLFIDPDGASLRGFDLSNPGSVDAFGQAVVPEFLSITARDIGQVFGIALDDATDPTTNLPAPNIYVTATSAYGLPIIGPDSDGDGIAERLASGAAEAMWMEGLFAIGQGGGPGSVWKIDGLTGEASLLTNIVHDQQPNSGAALGNIAFDGQHRQLLVSDRDTGLIHRLDLDGNELEKFDHGVTGHGVAGLEAVPFDTDNRANISDSAFDPTDPTTWGLADPERRVWGLAIRDGRLFYAIADGPQIWSIGLNADGSFDALTTRWELDLADEVEPHEVADIGFADSGEMILAQRPPVSGAADFGELVSADGARVLRYRLESPDDPNTESRWQQTPEEFAIGTEGEHRNATGGLALGYGYGPTGTIDRDTCKATVWATGDRLGDNPLPPIEPGTDGLASGVQGTPAGLTRPDNVPPANALVIDYDGQYPQAEESGHVGDIEIAHHCPPDVLAEGPGAPGAPVPTGPGPAPPPWPPPGVAPGPPAPHFADLRVEKRLTGACAQGQDCSFEIVVTNLGPSDYQGPLVLADSFAVPGVTLTGAAPAPWTCQQAGNQISCNRPTLLLRPGRSAALPLKLRYAGNPNIGSWQNCVALTWLGRGAADAQSIRALQTELARLGYYKGAIDGIAGTGTRNAIRGLEQALGLPQTGRITPALVERMFGPGASTVTDPDAANDTACVRAKLEATKLQPEPKLTIKKVGLESKCYANKTCRYKIIFSNIGAGPYKGALKFTDNMPNGWTYAGVQPSGWICQPVVPGQFSCALPVPMIWPPITTLKAGESKDVIIELKIPPNQKKAEVKNCVSFDIGKGKTNPVSCATTSVDVSPPLKQPVFTILKKGPDYCMRGGKCRYDIIFKSGSGGDFGPFKILDQLPHGWKLVSSSGAPTCKQGQGSDLVVCEPFKGNYNPNYEFGFPIEVQIPQNAKHGSKVTNCAELNFQKFGPISRSCVTTTVGSAWDLAVEVFGPLKCRAGDKQCIFKAPIGSLSNSANTYSGLLGAKIEIDRGKPTIPGLKFSLIKNPSAPWQCDNADVGKTGAISCHYGKVTLAPGSALKPPHTLEFSLVIPSNAVQYGQTEIEVCATLLYMGKPDGDPGNDRGCFKTKLGDKKPGGKKYNSLKIFKTSDKPCLYNVEECIFRIIILNDSPSETHSGKLKIDDVFKLTGWKFTKSPSDWKCGGVYVYTCEKNVVLKPKQFIDTTWGLKWLQNSSSPNKGVVLNCANLYINGTYVDQDCVNLKMETGRQTFSIGLSATGTPVCTPPNCSFYEFTAQTGNAAYDGPLSMKIMPPPGSSFSTPRVITSNNSCPASGWSCTKSGAEFGGAFACRIGKCGLAPSEKLTVRIDGKIAADLTEPPEVEQTREVCAELEYQRPGQPGSIEQDSGEGTAKACFTTTIQPITKPSLRDVDLALEKVGPAECLPGETCDYSLKITNTGQVPFAGPIKFTDRLPNGWKLVFPASPYCRQNGDVVACEFSSPTLGAGEAATIVIEAQVPTTERRSEAENCAQVEWPGAAADRQGGSVTTVQQALNELGYDAGRADGILGQRTRAAIERYQNDSGLPRTSAIDGPLLGALLDKPTRASGDLDPENDRACVTTRILAPAEPEPEPTDLEVSTRAVKSPCVTGQTCRVYTAVNNVGERDYAERIEIEGRVSPPVSIRSVTPFSREWSCRTVGGGRYVCGGKPVRSAADAPVQVRLALAIPRNFQPRQITHSVRLVWPLGKGDANSANDTALVTIPIAARSPPPKVAPPPPSDSCTGDKVRVNNRCVCPRGTTEIRGGRCVQPQVAPPPPPAAPPRPSPSCTGGKVRAGNRCVCPRGTIEVRGGRCVWPQVAPPPPQQPALPPPPPRAPIICPRGTVDFFGTCVPIQIDPPALPPSPPSPPPPPPQQGSPQIQIIPAQPTVPDLRPFICPPGLEWTPNGCLPRVQ